MTATASRQRWLVGLSLFALYLIWGSTYLAMRFAIEGFPPFMMAGIRFVIAGGLFVLFLRLRGTPWPNPAQWRSSFLVGGLLLLGGNGAVAYAEQWIGSGVAALAIATVPLWTVLFSELWGHRSSRHEWLGILVGFAGVGLLSFVSAPTCAPAPPAPWRCCSLPPAGRSARCGANACRCRPA